MNLFPKKIISIYTTLYEYYGICVKNIIYASQNYSNYLKLNSSVIKYIYTSIEKVGIIKKILKVCNFLEMPCYNKEKCKASKS